MIRLERYGDVVRVRMSSRRSRSMGYEVSAYFTRGVLVDCGFPHVAPELAELLGELRPSGALITHSHEDHAGNASLLARHGIPLDLADATHAEIRAGHRIRAYRRYTWGQPRPFTESFEPFRAHGLRTIAAPGHAADHRIVWDAERDMLLSADLWLGVHARLMHVEENPRQLVRDLRAAAALRPVAMFDAHRGPVPEPVRALNAKADWLEETIAAIEAKVAAGWSDRAIVRGVLRGEELAGYISRGEYARANLVRNVRVGAGAPRGNPA